MTRTAAFAVLLLGFASIVATDAHAQEAPAAFVLPAGDANVVILGDTGRSVKGFLVYRRERGGPYRLLTEEPVVAAADPYAAADLMGPDFRWLAGKVGSADPPTVWRAIRTDWNRAQAFALVSHGLRRALGRTFVDTDVVSGRSYTYRIVLLDATMREHDRVEAMVTAGARALPQPPSGVTCEAGDREVTVGWDYRAYRGGDDVVVGFHVYRSEAGSESSSAPVRLTAAPVLRADGYLLHFDESVTNGVSYRYTVTAVDLIGAESRGTAGPVVTPADTEPPLVPAGVTALDTEDGIRVLWNISPNLDVNHYNVLRSRRSNEGYERVNDEPIPFDTPSFVDDVAILGVTYYYKVVAVDEAGNESSPGGPAHVSPRDTEPPGPIVDLRATLDAERRAVELGWEPSTEPDLRGYFVYRGDAPDSLIRVTPRPCLADECVFADDGYKGRGLLPGSSVVYAVSAVDLSYNEGPHVYTTVEVPDNVAPDAPFSLSARLQPDGSVRLAWMVRREEEIERFLVYRTVRDRTIVVAEPAGETSRWTDASIRRGVATEYRVTAVDVTGNESAPSEPVVVTSTDIVAPATPRGLRVDPAEEGALVRWEPGAEDDVAGYIVYRSRYRGARPERMTDGLVADARFEDPAGRPGMLYAVRAVDSSGNESGTSPAVVFEEAEP